MFENLTERLSAVFRGLRSRGVLRPDDVKGALREVRVALLEADVQVKVVRELLQRVEERALQEKVLESLSPVAMVVKVLRDEMQALLGAQPVPLDLDGHGVRRILVAGLQGSGKTTTVAKLARRLASQGRVPLVVSTDVRRPAAREQLAILAREIDVEVHDEASQDAVALAKGALRRAEEEGHAVLLVDTAGRLHVDEELMEELRRIKEALKPREVLYVADAMTGQDAVRAAAAFHEAVGVTGIVLTKMDGDARGGAALSIRHATGVPVKFIGTGERVDALEPFRPEGMVSRILGMGDVLSLVEKAEAVVDKEEAERMRRKVVKAELNFEDMLDQLRKVRKMGPLTSLLELLPGGQKLAGLPELDEKEMKHVEALVLSMTPEERRSPGLLNPSRKKRIARGAGRPLDEVNRLVNQFKQMKKMLRRLQTKGRRGGNPFAGLAPARR